MKICTKCVLPETFPGISFNDDGVCNHCEKFESFAATPEQKAEYQLKLMNLVYKHRTSDPQILMAYSGGKDSTYSLRLFVEKYKARVLAFTFDNGFISDQAWRNIEEVCTQLDVDHIIVSHHPDMMNDLFKHAADHEMYPKKTMEFASTVCTLCSGFFKSAALKIALENEIPMMGYGWSPGQAPIQSALKQTNPKFVQMSQKGVIAPVVNVVGDEAREYFLHDHHYNVPAEQWPINVHPLAFEEYDETAIKESIKELGWVEPTDVDTNSTNCTLNAFANQVHLDKHGFHPYALEVANMVRQGTMSREEGIEKIYSEQNPHLVDYAKWRLNLKED